MPATVWTHPKFQNYADLAGPEFEGRVCVRSSSNVYNQSLVAGMIAEHGTEVAEEFARGIAQNLARTPQGRRYRPDPRCRSWRV